MVVGRPILAASALVALVGVVGVVGAVSDGDDGGNGADAASTSSVAVTEPPTTLPPTTTTVPKTTIAQALSKGMAGPEVERLQLRLQELGFQPGPIDGQFGDLTRMAVWAYQKLVMGIPFRDPDGVVTPDMWLALQDPLPVHALRSTAGRHTEIYLPQQVLVAFDGDTPLFITHISSGELAEPGDDFTEGAEWCEEVTIDPGEAGNEDGTEPIKQGYCGNAWTPGGMYRYYRKHEGTRDSRLGGMLNPVYFNNGIAVHGAYNVPLEPASHGCIRMPNFISQTFFDLVNVDEQVFVFDGVQEPESYGAQSGLWDWKDPNYTTTTSSTTTTTTIAPVTVPVPTTTVPAPPPATTSTVAEATTTTVDPAAGTP